MSAARNSPRAKAGDRVIAGRAENVARALSGPAHSASQDLLQLTQRLGWSFLVHHTDRPAEEVGARHA